MDEINMCDKYKMPWSDNSTNQFDYNNNMFSKFLDDFDSKKRSKMKKYEMNLPDNNGEVSIGLGCVFIIPITTGFVLYTNPEGTIEVHAFSDFEVLLEYMNEHKLMDMTQRTVSDNI